MTKEKTMPERPEPDQEALAAYNEVVARHPNLAGYPEPIKAVLFDIFCIGFHHGGMCAMDRALHLVAEVNDRLLVEARTFEEKIDQYFRR